MKAGQREYVGARSAKGPLLFVEDVSGVGYNERVEIVLPEGKTLNGRVLEISEDLAVIEVFEGTSGLAISDVRVRFTGRPFHMPVSRGDAGEGLRRPRPAPWTAARLRSPKLERDVNGRADQSRGPCLSAGFHPDRNLGHRRDEHPGSGTETADLHRLWASPQRPGGPDHSAMPASPTRKSSLLSLPPSG